MTRTTTTRGVLWEVLAPVVRWPMYSPKRFGLVLLALLVVLLVVGELTSDEASEQPAPGTAGARPGASSSTAPAHGETSGDDEGHSSHASEATDPGTERSVAALARRFVGVYVDSGRGRAAWLSDLRDMTTPELGRSLATVDRADVAALGRRVVTVDVRGVGATAAAAVVETDRGAFSVDVSHSGRTWQVASVVPSDPGDRGTT